MFCTLLYQNMKKSKLVKYHKKSLNGLQKNSMILNPYECHYMILGTRYRTRCAKIL